MSYGSGSWGLTPCKMEDIVDFPELIRPALKVEYVEAGAKTGLKNVNHWTIESWEGLVVQDFRENMRNAANTREVEHVPPPKAHE